jgi:transcriptional repressor NrdR
MAMKCPYCNHNDSRVIDSRDVNDGIRRRRQCLECLARFTTYERWQPSSLFIIKKDGQREEFLREKVLAGIRKACEKRPLPGGTEERLADEIEAELYQAGKTEIPSAVIGDMVMARLKSLDHVAYLRFASVYREFADITTWKEEIDTLAKTAPAININQLPLLSENELGDMVNIQREARQ